MSAGWSIVCSGKVWKCNGLYDAVDAAATGWRFGELFKRVNVGKVVVIPVDSGTWGGSLGFLWHMVIATHWMVR